MTARRRGSRAKARTARRAQTANSAADRACDSFDDTTCAILWPIFNSLLGGWESPEMVRRYAHLAADHLAPYAERLSALRDVEEDIHGTHTAQA